MNPAVHITQQDILYEDRWLLALNKHAGWYTTPTVGDTENNIRVALTHFLQQRTEGAVTLHLAHQLDRDTSGILLCSLHREVNAPLQEAFTSGSIEKTYIGVCAGAPSEDVFALQTGHGRKRGGWCVYPLEQVGRILPNNKPVRYAHTSFAVEQRGGDAAIVRATPHTGRTHQIRLHLAELGHPLLGDERYGGPMMFRGQPVPFHLLHAARLRLTHPVLGDILSLEAPFPAHMAAVVRSLHDQSLTMVPGN